MQLTEWERLFLEYYLKNYNAKWMRVYNNKHPIFETRVFLSTIYRRLLKRQAIKGEVTYPGMFKQLIEGKWYYIPQLLEKDKESKED